MATKPAYRKLLQSDLFRNSAWGLVSTMLQTLFVSLFFVIAARKFGTTDFAHFLIATTVYQLVVAFSSMGLGQWFIREFDVQKEKGLFTGKFIKLQMSLGVAFYFVNIILAIVLYSNIQIRELCIILGTNIIFDNLIYAIKNLNIAEGRQRTTSSILIIDGFLKLLIGCLMFVYPFSILKLSLLLLMVRFLTLNLFIRIGSSNSISIKVLWHAKISWQDIKHQVLLNWQFVVIGSISIIYWRFANIIASKVLTLQDVADYEISFRIFSIGLIVPTIASATVYAMFIRLYNGNNILALKDKYDQVFLIYNLFAFLAYAFIYTFAESIILIAFGSNYAGAVTCLQQMFLTFLIFPTVLLQANLIVAMKEERIDMWLNILSLVLNVGFCLGGLYFIKSLSVINYSILMSFVVFHILQNIFLLRRNIVTIKSFVSFYTLVIAFVGIYQFLSGIYNPHLIYIFSSVLIFLFVGLKIRSRFKLPVPVKQDNLILNTLK